MRSVHRSSRRSRRHRHHSQRQEPLVPPQPTPGYPLCPHCGRRLIIRHDRCRHCGIVYIPARRRRGLIYSMVLLATVIVVTILLASR